MPGSEEPINLASEVQKIPGEAVPESLELPEQEEASETRRKPEVEPQKEIATEAKAKPRMLPKFFQRSKPLPPLRDEVTIKIEKIMEDGLKDAYQNLSPIAQQEFKLKGEQTASKIQDLLRSTHVKVKLIFRLIVEWLKILPGINRFFLEQEAKIKTDKILMLKDKDLF